MKKLFLLVGLALTMTAFGTVSVEKRRLGSIRASETVVTDVKGLIDTGDVQRVINENVRTNYLASYAQVQRKLSLPEPYVVGTNFFPLSDGKGGAVWTWFSGGGGGGSLGKVTQVQDANGKWHNVHSEWDGTKYALVIDTAEAPHEEMTVQKELTRATNVEQMLYTNQQAEVAARIYADEGLQDQINAISTLGRFISTWNTATGLPATEPKVETLTYLSGDYYIVGSVSTNTPIQNRIPCGSYRDRGTVSECITNELIYVNDVFRYAGDGQWTRVIMKDVSVRWEQITGEPTSNRFFVAAVTNLSYYVTTNTVTKEYVDGLGLDAWIPKPDETVTNGFVLVKGVHSNETEWVKLESCDTNKVNDLIHEYDVTNITPRIENALNTNKVNNLIAIYDATNITPRVDGKMDKINSAQTNAINSGITATRVSTYDEYDGVMLKKTGGTMNPGAPIRFDNDYNGIYCDGLSFPLTLFSLTGFRFYNWDTQRYSDLIPDGSYVATSNKVASLINASVGNRFVSYERTSTQTDAMQKNARENIAAVKAHYGSVIDERVTESGSFYSGWRIRIVSGPYLFTSTDTVEVKRNGSAYTPLRKSVTNNGTTWEIVLTQYVFVYVPITGATATWELSFPVDPTQTYTTSITKTSQQGYDYTTSENANALGGHEASYFAKASDVSGKADKVSGYGLNDYLAALDSNGNLKNSTYKASSFASATALQNYMPKSGGTFEGSVYTGEFYIGDGGSPRALHFLYGNDDHGNIIAGSNDGELCFYTGSGTTFSLMKIDGSPFLTQTSGDARYELRGGGGGGVTPQVVTNIVTNVVSQAYIRQKLGVYLYVGPDNGIYVHVE